MKKFLVGIFIALLALFGFYFLQRQSQPQTGSNITEINEIEQLPITASFEIYTFGTKRDFSDSKYHNVSEAVYIQSSPPYNISVNESGTTWQDFFDTLPAPFKITPDCIYTGTGQEFCSSQNSKLYFFLNGIEDSGVLDKQIVANDDLIVRFE